MALVDDCVFCKIIRGEIPCCKIHEDDLLLSFLDLSPFNYGHALIIPKAHHHSITTLPAEYAHAMIDLAPKVAVAQMRELGNEAFNLLMNNGSIAGQSVPHVHLHVIPRTVNDDPLFNPFKKQYESMAKMAELAQAIAGRLAAKA